jgi:hypothetical protein
VVETGTPPGAVDVIGFGEDITAGQLGFRPIDNNLEASVIGSPESITIPNGYSDSAYRIEQFRMNEGQLLLDTQVKALVQAMAAFAPPAAGQTTLPQNYEEALAPVIAAHWS